MKRPDRTDRPQDISREDAVDPTQEDVLAVLSGRPIPIGGLGLALASAAGVPTGPEGAPVGQRLATAGLSLSGVQRLVDQMVAANLVLELRGKDLWDRGLPTEGTKATGRYYLSPTLPGERSPERSREQGPTTGP